MDHLSTKPVPVFECTGLVCEGAQHPSLLHAGTGGCAFSQQTSPPGRKVAAPRSPELCQLMSNLLACNSQLDVSSDFSQMISTR